MEVSQDGGTQIINFNRMFNDFHGFSVRNNLFWALWGTTIFGTPHIYVYTSNISPQENSRFRGFQVR